MAAVQYLKTSFISGNKFNVKKFQLKQTRIYIYGEQVFLIQTAFNAKCTNHITNCFDFCCCFGFGKNNSSGVKRDTRLPLVLDYPRQILDHLRLMPLKNELRGGHFGVITGMSVSWDKQS